MPPKTTEEISVAITEVKTKLNELDASAIRRFGAVDIQIEAIRDDLSHEINDLKADMRRCDDEQKQDIKELERRWIDIISKMEANNSAMQANSFATLELQKSYNKLRENDMKHIEFELERKKVVSGWLQVGTIVGALAGVSSSIWLIIVNWNNILHALGDFLHFFGF